MSAKNVILFGLTGAGKSSVVNLIAGEKIAQTSPDMEACTLHWEEYPITFDGHDYKVFDTVGFNHPNLGMEEYLNVIVNAHTLIERLHCEGGVIDLLLFCVRAGKVTATVQSNYRLFHEWLCEKKVPVVLVLTGLEGEERMEDWWDRNQHVFHSHDIDVVDHACITAADKLQGGGQQLYEESRRLVRDLVFQHTYGNQKGARTDVGAYGSVMQKLSELTLGNFRSTPKRKDIETILAKRCSMPPEAAKELASKIRSNLAGKSLSHRTTRQSVSS